MKTNVSFSMHATKRRDRDGELTAEPSRSSCELLGRVQTECDGHHSRQDTTNVSGQRTGVGRLSSRGKTEHKSNGE